MIDHYLYQIKKQSEAEIGDISFVEYFDSLLQTNDVDAKLLLSIANEVYLSSDKDKYIGLLEIGYFRNLIPDERILAFLVCIEVGKMHEAAILRTLCEPYSTEQVLFQSTSLFEQIRKKSNASKDNELIDMQAVEGVNDSEIVKISGCGYAKINPFLKPSIPWWSKQTFPKSESYIRLNHHEFFASKPLRAVNEEILIPANPSWFEKLEIYRNRKEGSSYYIEEPIELPRELDKFIDYKIKKARSLQVHAKRNNDGNLSLTLEELNEYYIDSGFLMGRCIHMDTDSAFGKSSNEAKLNHLDLSIQFYEEARINERRNQDLAKGKIVDANFRTHLFRIENIPFKAVIAYAAIFFESKYLVREWLKDQKGMEAIGG